MRTLICAPVTAENFSQAVTQMREIENQADITELRIDLMKNVGVDGIEYLILHSQKPVIATYRSSKEGGKARGNEKERLLFLKTAINAGVQIIDIELSTDKKIRNELIHFAKSKGTKVIVSFHDFKKTPSLARLLRFVTEAKKAGADIIKTATWKRTSDDNANAKKVLQYCLAKKIPSIVLTMSKTDPSMRFKAIRLGAFLTFGRIGKGSAPGQPTVSELKAFKKTFLKKFPKQKYSIRFTRSIQQKDKRPRRLHH